MTCLLKGIGASSGIAIAKAYHLVAPEISIKKEKTDDTQQEISRLQYAVDVAKSELEQIKLHTEERLGKECAEIFSAHILLLNDPELMNPIVNKITSESIKAETALHEVSTMYIDLFQNINSDYMRERAADIKDVTKRVMAHLLGIKYPDLALINEEVIIIANDLTPSDTAQINRDYVKGFVTDIGGRTSHSAIMARTLEIPAVVGTMEVTNAVQHDDVIIIDGNEGKVIVNPTAEELEHYRQQQDMYANQRKEWTILKDEPTFTKDGTPVKLFANIGTPEDVEGVIKNGAEGIGLFRTEFLYMGKQGLPPEEEQFEAYKTVLERMGRKPVVVRTLDIGGDKELHYLNLPKELNPFLGYRAIRFCLNNRDVFRPQLRALLRASMYGNLKIMFPMIATLEEFRKAKAMLEEEKKSLLSDGFKVSDNIEVGIMVEIPSTALLASQFAKEVDFFSIGTNDLIQYTMAADRMNERVAHLYQPYHPAILTLINNVVEAAHMEGKWVGICGEMAGDSMAISILLGLGLDELSMSAPSILPARAQIRKLSEDQLKFYKQRVLQMSTADEVVAFISGDTLVCQ